MQVAASPAVDVVRGSDLSDAARAVEREAELRAEDLAGKPDAIKAAIVEGRLGKILKRKVTRGKPSEPVSLCPVPNARHRHLSTAVRRCVGGALGRCFWSSRTCVIRRKR